MGIRSYDLSGDSVQEILSALKGDENLKSKWVQKFSKWIEHRNTKLKIHKLAKKWLVNEIGKNSKLSIVEGQYRYEWKTDEDRLNNLINNHLDHMSCIEWDETNKKAVLSTHCISKPLSKDADIQRLLDFLTVEFNK